MSLESGIGLRAVNLRARMANMKKISYKKEFIKFLHENDIYLKYIRAWRDGMNKSRVGPDDYIGMAFWWDYTSDGIIFWEGIYAKWRRRIIELKNKKPYYKCRKCGKFVSKQNYETKSTCYACDEKWGL